LNKKILFGLGILAPLLYGATVIIGAWLRPDYSHATHAISELTAVGAPNKLLLDSLFSIYNLLLIGFAAVFLANVEKQTNDHWTGKAGSYLILLVGLVGLLTNLFFPMDPRDIPATPTGIIHLVLAGILSLGTILSTLFLGLWMVRVSNHKTLGIYTLFTCGVIFLSGGFAAAAAANLSPMMGIVQRITIGAFMQWLVILGSCLLLTDGQPVKSA
jgi:hypothetical membrane protein